MKPIPLSPQHQASDPRASAWVAANAGSGKTHVLIDRIMRLLLDGAEPSRILCLTFTKAAAAEMAGRLSQRLAQWVMLDDEALRREIETVGTVGPGPEMLMRARQLFTRALETPGGLKIQTIHAFCERLLQLFPVEAGVAPGFEVMDERGAHEAIEETRRKILAEARRDANSAMGRALGTVIRYAREDSFDDMIEAILAKRADFEHVLADAEGVTRAIGALRTELGLPAAMTVEDIRSCGAIDRSCYADLATALDMGSKSDRERAAAIRSALSRADATLADFKSLYVTQQCELRQLSSIATQGVRQAHGWIERFLIAEQARTQRLCELAMIAASEALLTLAAAIVGRYEADKRRSGRYDFDDLIARARSLLTRSGAAQWVLYKLDGGIDHILVDEAQDTSPAQWEIAAALAEEFFSGAGARGDVNRTLFVVGDRKQSIFSFQGADPDAFEQARAYFQEKIESAGKEFRSVGLDVSRRSTRRILDAVDQVFAQDEARKGLNLDLGHKIKHDPIRTDDHGVIEIWPLIGPDDKEEEQPWRAPVDAEPQNHPRRKLAARIARTIAGWIGRRMLPSQNRAVGPGDILVLVRRRNSFFDALIRELRRHGVPVAGADRLKLAEHIAVKDALALAQFVLLPEDDYTLACVLKSPLVARADGLPIDEADLFELAHARGSASLWRRIETSGEPRFAPAVEKLKRWFEIGPALAPYEFFARLLIEMRKDIVARLGPEANDPLDALLDAALDHEQSHAVSLAGFLGWFLEGEAEIKRNMDPGAGEVRIMTVHGAKGLESNIVILPDTADVPDRMYSPIMAVRPVSGGPPLPFWLLPKTLKSTAVEGWCAARRDGAGDEYRRLLYVAMTRARDELYVCGCHGRNEPRDDCWYWLVRNGLESVAVEIADGDGGTILRLAAAEPQLRVEPGLLPEVIGARPEWLARDARSPSAASVQRASTLFAFMRRSPLAPDSDRMFRRGRFIHRLLQILPDIPPPSRRATAQMLGRRDGFEPDCEAVLALLAHPDFAHLFESAGLAEVPVMARLGGRSLAGRIDRLLVAPGEVLILDYKTDAEPPRDVRRVDPAYIAQLAAYREAVRLAVPDRKVRAALLWTEIAMIMEIPGDMLDLGAWAA